MLFFFIFSASLNTTKCFLGYIFGNILQEYCNIFVIIYFAIEQRDAYDALKVENDVAKGQQFYECMQIKGVIENQEEKKNPEITYKDITSGCLIYRKTENNMHMKL